MSDSNQSRSKHYVLPKSHVISKQRRLEIADAIRGNPQLDLDTLATEYGSSYREGQTAVLVDHRKKEAPKVKQESRPSRPLFEIDDVRKLRRPQMTMAGKLVPPGEAFQVIEVEPVQGRYGPTYVYVLVRLDGDGNLLSTHDESNLLRLSQIKLKRDSRKHEWQNPCPTSPSEPTTSSSLSPGAVITESSSDESGPEENST